MENTTLKIDTNAIYNMDCLEGMCGIKDKSIDMILVDPPYGTTACKWDSTLPLNDYIEIKKKKMEFEDFLLYAFKSGMSYDDAVKKFEEEKQMGLWSHYKRIIKDDGAIVIFGAEPFSSVLRDSNMEMYKYDWIWKKNTVDGFFNSKCRPLKTVEMISVFSKKQARAKGDNMVYYPQGLIPANKKVKERRKEGDGHQYFRDSLNDKEYVQEYTNYPTEILEFAKDKEKFHDTQKPVALCEYLIKTYTKEGQVVLDNCMGSGSTIVACLNTNRQYIGFEKNEKVFEVAKKRIGSQLEAGHSEQ